jgi:zinc protease
VESRKTEIPDEGEFLEALNKGKQANAVVQKVSDYRYGSALIEEFQLGNGLQVLIWEDKAAPVIAYQTWFRVGSRHERPGKTGIAHLFEHLMFKATKSRPEGQFDVLMEAQGAQTNAATWVDWTYYHEKLPKGNLALAVELEADRMENLALESGPLESERDVVKNERLGRVDNDPDGKMYETLYRAAFESHPYGCPTIGWMEDIEGLTMEDCLAFYKSYYAPNNAVVSIVGDVETHEVLQLIQSYYGHMSSHPIPTHPIPPEPPQEVERRLEIKQPIESEKLILAYHVPSVTHEDHPALCVLNEILTDGESSPMFQELVQELELATDTWGWVASFHDPGLWELGVSLLPDKRASEAEAGLNKVIDRIAREGVTQRALEKAKNGMEADTLRMMAGTSPRARGLGEAAVIQGRWQCFFEESELLQNVTADDVMRVLGKYLRAENRTVLHALPKDEEPNTDEN